MWAALAPVRAALLRRAREQAAGITAQARREAEDALARARSDAAAQLASGREAGREQALPLAAAVRSRGRRQAQAAVLNAQREAYERLRGQVRASVAALRSGPEYGSLRKRLRRDAARAAGPGATVTEAPGGGVVAHGPGIVVDCSLPRLADAAVDALGGQVTQLWTPDGPRRRPARPHRSGPAT
jgi:vacuolar-type H+-ATPase subunit E/Vma4